MNPALRQTWSCGRSSLSDSGQREAVTGLEGSSGITLVQDERLWSVGTQSSVGEWITVQRERGHSLHRPNTLVRAREAHKGSRALRCRENSYRTAGPEVVHICADRCTTATHEQREQI